MSGERGVIIEGSWVVMEGLLVHNTHQEGVSVRITAPHVVVSDLEITDTGFGIYTRGDSGLFTKNYIHDLHMVNNTKDEGDGDDDYGAAGIVFDSCASNEASYNVAERCIAPSYDYGVDGGFFETWLDVSGSYVHHNLAIDCDGFLEVGGQGSLVRDTRVVYNISVNNGRFAWFHLGGKFGVEIKNFRVENNTIVHNTADSGGAPATALAFSPSGDYAYVTYMWTTGTPSGNSYWSTVKTYAVNQSTGLFTGPIGSAATGDSPWAIVVTPDGHYAYVGNATTNNGVLDIYSVNQSTGVLSLLSSSLFLPTAKPASLAMDSQGRFLYVGQQYPTYSHNLVVYSINPANGSLTNVWGGATGSGSLSGPISVVAERRANSFTRWMLPARLCHTTSTLPPANSRHPAVL